MTTHMVGRSTVTVVLAVSVAFIAAPTFAVDMAAPSVDGRRTAVMPEASLDPDVAIVNADSSERQLVRESLDRFRRSGLSLPDVDVVFTEDADACRGHLGLFEEGMSPWRLTICSSLPFVVTHELSHAWIATHVTADTRSAYMAHRRLSVWNDSDVEWSKRGVEDAAFVLQQNLTAAHQTRTGSVWAERVEAFEMLTGQVSPVRQASAGRTGSGGVLP